MDRILDLIYDAAGEHELWPAVLTAIADLTQSEGGILFGQSLAAEQVYFDFNGRLNQECSRIYQERHMQNPWSLAMEQQPVGHLVLSDEVVALGDLKKSGFYDDVLQPQGIGHNAMIALAARDDFRVAFNICRSKSRGEFETTERKLLEALAPHLRRSVTLGFKLTGYRALRNAAFDVIDKLSDGVVVMGLHGRVLFANRAACSLEAEGTLKLKPSIATWSPAHSRRLASLVRSALAGGAGGTASVPSSDRTRLITVVVVGLRSREVSSLSWVHISDGACAAFIIDPLQRDTVGAQQLMDAYGLTKAEARVAVTACSGRTTAEAGLALGLSPNTVKTHLRRVFAKTDTGGHAGLAALLATLGVVKAAGKETT
ncbi:helix-turn-helix transcriptional regulator [Bradyrhizobium diazoefficiens]|uniref:helix-turn-helix transcriptional regulator n=1 Tax=Bradyrhizobium diazoefficiens TaxID=1355477 RepID=UPI00190ACE29|nr:helix-turn-helix transcriptional regulator [Bradyrhizobium diazoefficiens]MBK3664767.1 helix-turn-helix transcriptional regulator [Bradyrhizobium diazoefficiens]